MRNLRVDNRLISDLLSALRVASVHPMFSLALIRSGEKFMLITHINFQAEFDLVMHIFVRSTNVYEQSAYKK